MAWPSWPFACDRSRRRRLSLLPGPRVSRGTIDKICLSGASCLYGNELMSSQTGRQARQGSEYAQARRLILLLPLLATRVTVGAARLLTTPRGDTGVAVLEYRQSARPSSSQSEPSSLALLLRRLKPTLEITLVCANQSSNYNVLVGDQMHAYLGISK